MSWYRFPLGVFLVTRGGLFLLAYLGLVTLPLTLASGSYWQGFPHNMWLDGWARWDSGWYQGIADHGYTNLRDEDGFSDTRFFPAYPVLMRCLGLVTGNTLLAGIVISNLSFLLALIGLYALVKARFGEEVARRSLVLLSVYPYAFFFGAVYTESLFLAATVAAFYFGERRQWVVASLFASLAAAIRVPGCLVSVGLALLYLEQISFDPRRIRPDILALSLGALLPALHCYNMWQQFDDPFIFLHSHVHVPTGGTLTTAIRPLDLLHGTEWFALTDKLHVAAFLLAFPTCLLAFSRVGKAWALWALLNLLLDLLAWHSMGRYVCVLFPIFVMWARLVPEWVFWSIAFLSTLLLTLLTLMFTHWAGALM